jgi:dTDP-4-dehydrorhamnose 3,5-epimerase
MHMTRLAQACGGQSTVRIEPTPLLGVVLIHTTPVRDHRGRFTRIYCAQEFEHSIRPLNFVQTNLSRTEGRGSVRGLHYQRSPAAEAKLIRCLRGKVFDVTVDLRASSPTFLQWYSVELSEDAECQILIPEGCAHGFQVVSDGAELLYQHTAPYTRDLEGGVRCDDPMIGIKWPLPLASHSQRDSSFALLDKTFEGIRV